MADNYTVHRLGSAQDCEKLEDFLERGGAPVIRGNRQTQHELLNKARQAGCNTVVVEHTYLDEDYRRCHLVLHNLAQARLSRYCRRLHFFRKDVTVRQLRKLTPSQVDSYMGMMVRRPLNSFPVGRSVLDWRMVQSPKGKQWKPFLTCTADYTVHLAGNELSVRGFPFIQQDHLVAACATAAIWMGAWYMAQRYDEFVRVYSPEITQAAARYDMALGRGIPSEGLTIAQMLGSLRALGYDVHSIGLEGSSATFARRALFGLVESQMPVIAALFFEQGGHAVTVCGYAHDVRALPEAQTIPRGKQIQNLLSYVDAADYCPAFIINDDASGPYRWMEVVDIQDALDGLEAMLDPSEVPEKRCFLESLRSDGQMTVVAPLRDGSGHVRDVAGLAHLTGLVPSGVTVQAADAQLKALAAYLVVREDILLDQMTVRTYLTDSRDWRAHVSCAVGERTDFAWWVKSFYYPKWVWVTEFSLNSGPKQPQDRDVYASVVVDSTAPKDTLDFVFMHRGPWVIPVERQYVNVFDYLEMIGGEHSRLVDRRFKLYAQMKRVP